MILKTINDKNLSMLRVVFEEILLDNGIRYKKIGLVERDDELVFLFETDEKVHTFGWAKANCLNQDIQLIAKEVLEPMIPRLKIL